MSSPFLPTIKWNGRVSISLFANHMNDEKKNPKSYKLILDPHPLSILQRLRDMFGANVIGSPQIRNGPRDFDRPVIAARGEAESIDRRFEELFRISRKRTETIDLTDRHLLIRHKRRSFESMALALTCVHDSLCDEFR